MERETRGEEESRQKDACGDGEMKLEGKEKKKKKKKKEKRRGERKDKEEDRNLGKKIDCKKK